MLGAFEADGRQPTEDEVMLVTGMWDQIAARLGRELTVLNPIAVKSQVVAGMNYWFKVQIDGDEYIHVKIYKSLPHTQMPPEITEVQTGMTADDPLG